jgi:hypothetical protein
MDLFIQNAEFQQKWLDQIINATKDVEDKKGLWGKIFKS